MPDNYFDIIKILEDNKRFPHYAAERRIDLFLAYFIKEILTKRYGEEVAFVAPEFPFLRNDKNLLSYKADLLCVFTDKKEPLLIELKTDTKSFKENQQDHYKKMGNWQEMIKGVKKMTLAKNTPHNRFKYFHLMQKLVDSGLAQYSEKYHKAISKSIIQLTANTTQQKSYRSKKIKLLANGLNTTINMSPRVLYMVPETIKPMITLEDKIEVLSFNEIEDEESSNEYKCFVNFLKNI